MKKNLSILIIAILIIACVSMLSCDDGDSTTSCDHRYMSYETIKEPTCEKDGVQIVKCSKCDDEKTEAIEKAGHNFQNGSCTVCGENE